MIRVLVVDDNAVVRGGLVALLAALDDIEVVGEAATGQEAIDRTQVLTPDVVLLDVRMPVLDGVSAAATIARTTRVLMLTYSDEPSIVTSAIRAGAAGYLVHGTFDPDRLGDAIRTVHAGGSLLSEAATPIVFEALRTAPAAPTDGRKHGLTEREAEVMDLVARGRSNTDIARDLFISAKTVKNHINHIYVKLDVSHRSEAIAVWLGLDEVEA
jgi:DNA-binding NarL/FixJ family response regulator